MSADTQRTKQFQLLLAQFLILGNSEIPITDCQNIKLGMPERFILYCIFVFTLLSACKKDDTSPPPGSCFADKITLTQTDFIDYKSAHSIFVSLDAKNTSSKDYDVSKGAKLVNMKIVITTTDSAQYETHIGFTETYIPAGASASVIIYAEYGAGKTYQDYKIITSCN